MKICPLKLGMQISAFAMLITFISGLVWSVYPLGGATLPRWVEAQTDISFTISALLISVLLGIVIVLSMLVAYAGLEFDWCKKKVENG